MTTDRVRYDATGFRGRVERTRAASEPWWPEPLRARRGAPNIVIVYMDDMGYSDPGCFGSEIETPNIDALAARGLRFNHYTTHPICSPARAALLTGRNAHAVGTGWLANNNAGFPGYTGEIPCDAATLPETLRAAGYATLMVGKWHNTPGPLSLPSSAKDSWPTQRGFEHFYGFMEGETNFFFPARLMLGNALLPIDEYPRGYYSTDDWTDRAMDFVRDHRAASPNKPFFLYVANNAVHAPFQAKAKDIAKYRGRYDLGWTRVREARYRRQLELGLIPAGTRLAPSDPAVPAWDDTDPADRPLFARHMETYAAMLDCADQNLGRLVALLERMGELDNTIIVFSSDNGGTHAGGPIGSIYNNRRFSGLPEDPIERERERMDFIGGPRSNALYPTGWGQVSNTPFPTYKTYTGGGGRRVSFVISWPARITDGGAIRSQFVHVTDVMPTLLDLAGVAPLAHVNGQPVLTLDGRSFASVLLDAAVPSPRREQYYECWSNRGYYRDGWLARSLQRRGEPIDLDNWTLHDLSLDFSESEDVRERHPERLRELVAAFDETAWLNLVYPLDNRTMVQKMNDGLARAGAAASTGRRFAPDAQTVHRAVVVPLISDRSFRVRAAFARGDADQGVIWAIGEQIGGMVLYVEDGRLRFCYNGYGEFSELPPVALPVGEIEATLEYEALGSRRGRGRLLINGAAQTAWRPLSPTLMAGFHEGLDIGIDRRAPVSWDVYQKHGTFRYTGTLRDVTIEPAPARRTRRWHHNRRTSPRRGEPIMAVVLGTGAYRYEVVDNWAKLPPGQEFNADVAAVGVDKQDRVYAFNRGKHPMVVLDRDGNFLRSWGEGLFPRAHGVHMAPDDTIWLTDDGDHTVRHCTLDGKVLLTLGIPGTPRPYMSGEPFHRCTHTALSPQGDLYVSDGYGNSRVHRFAPSGTLLRSWGEPGSDPGQFNIPHNICCDADGWVYVADRENHRVQVFDGNGKFETQWVNMHRPSGLFMEPGGQGRFFVGEIGGGMGVNYDMPNIGPRVSIYSHTGQLLARLGQRPAGLEPGQFISPHGLAVDSRGDIYVGEVSYTNWGNRYKGQPHPPGLRSLQKLVKVS